MILATLVSLLQPALTKWILAHISSLTGFPEALAPVASWYRSTHYFCPFPAMISLSGMAALAPASAKPALTKGVSKASAPWRGNSPPLCLHGATICNFWALCVLKIWDLMLPSNSPFFLHTTLHLTILRQTYSHLHSLLYPSGPNSDKLFCACFASTVCCIFTCPSNYSLSILFHCWFVNKFWSRSLFSGGKCYFNYAVIH